MANNGPSLSQTLLFLQFLIQAEQENYADVKSYRVELRQHSKSLDELIEFTKLIEQLSENDMSTKQNNQDSEIVMKVKELWDKRFGNKTKDVKATPQPGPLFQTGYLGGTPPIAGGMSGDKSKEQRQGIGLLDGLYAANQRQNGRQ